MGKEAGLLSYIVAIDEFFPRRVLDVWQCCLLSQLERLVTMKLLVDVTRYDLLRIRRSS